MLKAFVDAAKIFPSRKQRKCIVGYLPSSAWTKKLIANEGQLQRLSRKMTRTTEIDGKKEQHNSSSAIEAQRPSSDMEPTQRSLSESRPATSKHVWSTLSQRITVLHYIIFFSLSPLLSLFVAPRRLPNKSVMIVWETKILEGETTSLLAMTRSRYDVTGHKTRTFKGEKIRVGYLRQTNSFEF